MLWWAQKGADDRMEQDFGARLKGYRKGKNLTQQELAERVGVSDKTVSRWESGGGYPDVPVLVPLARALGVTVDDLLDGERPIRTLSRADWQSLLSFAFALGGGALFFLLDQFMPMLLCYLAYLGCLAYGVYLQKYYAYQSRWFLLGEAVVNLGVNLSVAWYGAVFARTALSLGSLLFLMESTQIPLDRLLHGPETLTALLLGTVVLGFLLTAVTQYLVWKKGFEGQIPLEALSQGHGAAGHAFVSGKLRWRWPVWRKALPALVPLLAGLYWLPTLWRALLEGGPALDMSDYNAQAQWFGVWLILLGILASLPLLKWGFRRWLIPVWLLTALCWGMTGLRDYEMMWSKVTGQIMPYRAASVGTGQYVALGWGSWGTLACALILAAVWIALAGCYLRREEPRG